MPALAACLLAVFLFAQGIVVVHDTDADAYESDHVCGICGVVSVLGGANIALAPDFEIASLDPTFELATATAFESQSFRRARARAPPISS